MNSNFSRILIAGAAVLSVHLVSAHATPLGFSADPALDSWNRGDANTGFMFYDTFPSLTFANATGTVSGINNAVFSQTLDVTAGTAGAGLYNVYPNPATLTDTNGEVYFGGGAPVLFTLSGEVSFTIRGLVFQIKRPASQAGVDSGTVIVAPKLSINGGPLISADYTSVASGNGDTTSAAPGNYSVTSYYWGAALAGLVEGGTNAFALTIDQGVVQRGFDGMSLDVGSVSVVPEPASATLIASGLGLLLARRRRKLAA